MGELATARRECEAAGQTLGPLDLPALSFQLDFVRGQIEQAALEPSAAYDATGAPSGPWRRSAAASAAKS
jgi:hypothetical protein